MDRQCHFVEVATELRSSGGAPDPTKPVLVLDNDEANGGGGNYDVARALDNAFGMGVVPRVVFEPQSAEWAAEPLTTDRYSAIIVASDYQCGGCDLNPPQPGVDDSTADSDAINARKADIEAFFNAGGGIYANAGGVHGDGDPSTGADVYLQLRADPSRRRGGHAAVLPDLRRAGAGLRGSRSDPDESKRAGTRDDINCCATHNSFAEPDAGTAAEGLGARTLRTSPRRCSQRASSRAARSSRRPISRSRRSTRPTRHGQAGT